MSHSPSLQLDQLRLSKPARPQDRNLRQRPTHHRNLVARIQPWASLAILVDLVRQSRTIDHSEPKVEEEIRNSGKQGDSSHTLLLRLRQQGTQQLSARSLTLSLRLHHNRPHLSQVWPIKMQRPAAQKNTGL